jgi:hypothetical protein
MSINLEKENAAEKLQEKGLEISEFDNKMTILYKIADCYIEPTAHFVIYGTLETGFTYLHLTQVVYSYLVAGKPLVECYQEILSIFVNIIPMDIAMTCREAAKITETDFFDQEETIGTDLNSIIKGINQMFKDINSKQEQDLIVFSSNKGDTYSLTAYYGRWIKEKKERQKLEALELDRINDIQGELTDIEPVDINVIIINTFTYRFRTILLKTGLAPRSEDGMTVFQEAKISEDVPYIQFDSSDGKNYYWMYDLSARSSELSPELFQPYLKESQPINSITFLLNMQEEADGKSQSKTNFIRCVIRLEDGSLKVKIPGDEENYDKCRRLIESAFPNLRIGDAEQIHLVGYFTVPNIIITEASYYYMLSMDSLSREYLYLKEGTGSWADKTQQNIHYKDSLEAEDNSSSVIISFDSYVPGESNDVIIEGLSAIGSESANVPGTIKFVIKADSRAASDKFIKIFGRLLAKYSEERTEIEKKIRSVIQTKKAPTLAGDNTQSKKTKKKDKTSTDVARSKLANLRRRTPDGYFDSKYSISCQCGFQPLVIQRDEVEDWRQYTFIKNGKSYPRKTAPYPPIELKEGERIEDLDPYDKRVEYWIVCPRNNHPYPAYKPNHKIAPSYDKRKFVPCCGKKDTLSSGENREEKVTTKVGKHQLTTLSLLDQPERIGSLGKVITQLMQSEASESDRKDEDEEEESEEEFKRFGIDIGVNSLILCVLKATRGRPAGKKNSFERKYNLAVNSSERNSCARLVRRKMPKRVNISAFRQELYDLSDGDIKAEIKGEGYFDSARLYRGLEEMFNVNIFVFRAHVDKSKLSKEDDFVMEIPRSKLIHIRPFRGDRESVLIFKHYGSKIDKSPFPHCELIVAYNARDKKYRYLFGEDITGICYKALMKTRTTLVWSLPEGAPAPYTAEDIVTRRNPFSVVNWAAVFDQLNPIGQQVDSYGKARALTLEVSADVRMTIFIPPSQPFNLEIIDDISQISEKLVLQIFGAPSGISANGLWYPGIDFRYCLFIPTDQVLDPDFQNPTSTRKTLRQSPKIWEYNPVDPQKTNLDHYRVNYDTRKRKLSPKLPAEPFDFQPQKGVFPIVKMRTIARNMFYLVQLTEWLFALRSDKAQTFSKWWPIWTKTYIMSMTKVNSEVILPAHLPKCASTEEGFSYLSENWPVFFRQNREGHWKIFMYQSLHDQLFKYLNKDAAKLQHREPALLLRGTHTWDSDFKPGDSNSYFFSGAKSALTWIDYQTNRDTTTFISNKAVAPAIAQEISKFPYLYKDSHTTKIFIIQNVKGGGLSRVINVCHIWATTAQNKGFLTDKYELGDFPPYVVYTISSAEDMIQVRDNSDGDLNYYHVVQYSGEERYAAMLPLV